MSQEPLNTHCFSNNDDVWGKFIFKNQDRRQGLGTQSRGTEDAQRQGGELMVELPDERTAERLTEDLTKRFGNQVLLAPWQRFEGKM
jgi:hypothetical protein